MLPTHRFFIDPHLPPRYAYIASSLSLPVPCFLFSFWVSLALVRQMYHEATLSNLFEVFLYYDYAAQAIGDALIDLVDWCVRKVTALVARSYSGESEQGVSERLGGMAPEAAVRAAVAESPSQAVDRHRADIRFRVGVVAVTMLRYLTEHITKLPLGVMSRLLDTHGGFLGVLLCVCCAVRALSLCCVALRCIALHCVVLLPCWSAWGLCTIAEQRLFFSVAFLAVAVYSRLPSTTPCCAQTY